MTHEISTQMNLSATDKSAKNHALIAYILMCVGMFTGIFWLVGFIWALATRSDAKESLFFDHYRNVITLFLWTVLWTVIGILTTPFIIGWVILFVLFVWTLYRLIKGISRLVNNRPYAG